MGIWRGVNSVAGDTKAGVLVGTDKLGNKFYENKDELPRESDIFELKSCLF